MSRQTEGMASRLRHLPTVVTATATVLALAVVIALMFKGPADALGVAAGVVLVAVSYLVSTFAIAWADTVHLRLVLPVGLIAYVVKFTVFGFVMAGIARTEWAGLPAMGFGIIIGILVWTITQALWVWRTGAGRV